VVPAAAGWGDGQGERFLIRVTDPVLEPVRRVLPRMGMFDLSPIIVFLVLVLRCGVLVGIERRSATSRPPVGLTRM
jgi:uncharacterized protein YggT (Ycf19 family)